MFPQSGRPSASPLPHVRDFLTLRVLPASPTSIAVSVSLRLFRSVNILALSRPQWISQVPNVSFSVHAMLSDPARVSNHLAICGGLLLPSKVLTLSASGLTFHEALSLHLRYGLDSLCLRLTYVVTFISPRLDYQWSGLLLSGMGISPIENTMFILAHQNILTVQPSRKNLHF